jgi:hypothetical protein
MITCQLAITKMSKKFSFHLNTLIIRFHYLIISDNSTHRLKGK